MGSERFWRIVWLAAVWHNIIGGLGLVFLGDWIYAREGLPFPEPGVNYVRWWFLILVFALVYYMVYRDLYNSRNLVIASIFAKISSATPDVYYLLFREGVPGIFWVTVGTDYAFAVLFTVFLGFLARHRQAAAAQLIAGDAGHLLGIAGGAAGRQRPAAPTG